MPFAAVSAIAINVVAMNRPAMQGGFRSAIAAHLPDHDTLPPHRGYVEFPEGRGQRRFQGGRDH
jgi:hypothetical protein